MSALFADYTFVIALLRDQHPEWSPEDVQAELERRLGEALPAEIRQQLEAWRTPETTKAHLAPEGAG